MITQYELKQHLHYDPTTGLFTRLVGQRRSLINHVVGDVKASGYRYIGVCQGRYRAHRLAFLYMVGRFPIDQVDHLDGDRDNNRWSNLREATNSENGKNLRLKVNNKTGCNGVSWSMARGKWRSRIMVDMVEIHLGLFTSLDEAVVARRAAEKKFGFHVNHGTQRRRYKDAA